MTVLALEPDAAQAAAIRHIVCGLTRVELELVTSKDEALRALNARPPDLLLLPALCSPEDEAELLALLRTLPDAAHVEALITPLLVYCAPDPRPPSGQRGWRRWRARRAPIPGPSHDPRAFAEQLTSSLGRAREVRQHRAKRHSQRFEATETGASDRAAVTQAVPDLQSERAQPPPAPVAEWRRLLAGREVDEVAGHATPYFDGSDPRAAGARPIRGLISTGVGPKGPPIREPTIPPERNLTVVRQLQADRRAHRRFPAHDLRGLWAARVKYGPPVSLVDLSASGALFETAFPLRPESEAVLELVGTARDSVVPFRVVRSQVSGSKGRLLYRGACAFKHPVELADLLLPRSTVTDSTIDSRGKFDIVLKTLIEQHVTRADSVAATCENDMWNSLPARQVVELVRSLQEASRLRRFDPVARSVGDLLTAVVPAFERSRGSAVTLTRIEEQLRRALPWLTARFADAPAPIQVADAETIFFTVPGEGAGARRVLSVELPQGVSLEEWQFRLLKASTYLAALLMPEVGATAHNDRRRHVRVTGPFDGRWLGAIEKPVVIFDLSEGGCFVNSFYEEERGRQLGLEIDLHHEGWIPLRAEAVHSRPEFGFAVRFIEMPEETRARLERFVAKRRDDVRHNKA